MADGPLGLNGRLNCTGWSPALLGKAVALLRNLPASGLLFPKITATPVNARSAEFYRRCRVVGIGGVSLHSYRYAWAERAKECGYAERFAQEALGHNNKAVHRAYARQARVILPSLESFEKGKVVPVNFQWQQGGAATGEGHGCCRCRGAPGLTAGPNSTRLGGSGKAINSVLNSLD